MKVYAFDTKKFDAWDRDRNEIGLETYSSEFCSSKVCQAYSNKKTTTTRLAGYKSKIQEMLVIKVALITM